MYRRHNKGRINMVQMLHTAMQRAMQCAEEEEYTLGTIKKL